MKILFVCTGNTCRSPIAEAIARKFANERGLIDLEIASAGTSAWEGAPASDGALLVCMERSIDLSQHRSQQLTRELVAASDYIFAMGEHHLERIEAMGGEGKAYLLTVYASNGATGRSVNDPFGGDLDVYRTTVDELHQEVRRILDRLAAERTPDRG
jgi:protein-tyrosine-phosphatase